MSEPLLAVVNYHCAGIGSYRQIVVQSNPERFLAEVSQALVEGMSVLIEHYAENFGFDELELFQENFGEGGDSGEVWSWLDVEKLVKRLPQIANDEYRRTEGLVVFESHWYRQIIGVLNDVFENGSGVWISLEGPASESLTGLLEMESSDCGCGRMNDAFAQWLGRLAVAAQWNWQENVTREMLQILHALVKDFDDRNAFN